MNRTTRMKALVIWAATLIACLLPHPFLSERWQHLLRQPFFFVIIPIVVTCIVLTLPQPSRVSEEVQQDRDLRRRKAKLWQALFLFSGMISAFFIWCLISLPRDPTLQHAQRVSYALALGGILILPLAGVGFALYKLKQLGHLWY